MTLIEKIIEKRPVIVKRWLDMLLESYPEDSRRFFKKESDQFANPVGFTFAKELKTLLEYIVRGNLNDEASSCLESIIRIRAVQDFSPSEAIGFMFRLKEVIRDVVGKRDSLDSDELEVVDRNIDRAGLLAFDIFSMYRERIYDLRVGEVRREVSRLLERANLLCEVPQ